MTDLSDIRRLVGRDSLLAALPEDSIQKVLALGKPRKFGKGEMLFQQGDAGDSAYMILSGAVKISVVSAAGREIVFAYLSVGDLVGDMSILDERPRTASATAAEAVDTMVIRGADLHRQMAELQEKRQTAELQSSTYRQRIDELNAQLVSLRKVAQAQVLSRSLAQKMDEISQRLQKLTLQIADIDGQILAQRVTLEDRLAELTLGKTSALASK